MNATASGLIDFIAASPSPFHCVAEVVRRLEAAGFQEDSGDGAEPAALGYRQRSGSVFAWVRGSAAADQAGFRLVGAHTDSPNLRLKPNAAYAKEGYAQLGVEPYGGALLHTWTDRDLGLSGRVVLRRGGALESALLRVERPIARVANLAIHLDRDVTTKGFLVNKQTHLSPLLALGSAVSVESLIAAELSVAADQIMGYDLGLHDLQRPTLGGLNDEFVFAPRLDNQASCYTALEALIGVAGAPRAAPTAVMALFDHEEVGSGSERGADSALFAHVLEDLVCGGSLRRALARSFLVSADMAHGVHPNYADRHEPHHKPMLGGGPVIKTNVNMRYATDGETSARFRAACQDETVAVQDYVVRSDLPCGSTIGAIAAAGLAVRTVDVGCAMLSMHSIREQAGAGDVDGMARVMRRLLRDG